MADKPKTPAKRTPAKRAPRKSAARKEAEAQATVTPIRRDQRAQGRNAAKHNPISPENLALTERRQQAYNLKRAWLTLQQIADQISQMPGCENYSKQRAHDDVHAMRDSITITPAREQLYDDLERLNALFTAVWAPAMRGDTKAVREARAILDQRAKYLGLYSPVRQILVGVDGGTISLEDLQDPADLYAATLAKLDDLLPEVKDPPALGGTS